MVARRPTSGTGGRGDRRRAAGALPGGNTDPPASNVIFLGTPQFPRRSGLWLARHCHACLADEHLVFLDLRTGTYCGLAPREARAALMVLECDDTLRARRSPHLSPPPDVMQDLLANGLVTTDPERGKKLTALATERATREAMGTGDGTRPRIRLRDLWHFLAALTGSALVLRLLPFRMVVWRERRRAARDEELQHARAAAPSLDDINRVVDQFLFLAPLFYSQRDRCLLNSLTLKRLLRRHGIAARWVFGVAADPFEAHCWLQVGDAVAGDTLMRIWRLTPIMIV